MADPLKDTSLDAAQREIHRRLLRQEKLTRIEQQEMRRLSAMGWKPPVGRTTTGGFSVHDAADAIEETQRRRRAFAQEAQRRSEEKLRRARIPETPMLDKYRLIPPGSAVDNRALHRELDESQEMLKGVERNLREGGANNAADMLHHYLDRSGRNIHFMPQELRHYEEIRDPYEYRPWP